MPHNPDSLDLAAHPQERPDARAWAEVERLLTEVERLRSESARHETRIACMEEIGVAMGSTLSLDDLLHVIMEKVTILMEADRSTLFLVDDGYLWSKIIQGNQTSEIRLKVGEGIAGWVAQTGKSVNIRDAYRDHRFNAEVDVRTGYQTRSILCQPIRNLRREIIGVVQVLNRKSGYFSVDDEHLLSALAAQAAVSIENSKLYLSVVSKNLELMETHERLKKKIAEVDMLFDLQRSISQAADLRQVVELVARKALGLVRAEWCVVTLEEHGHLRRFALRRGRAGEAVSEQALPLVGTLSARVMAAHDALVEQAEDGPGLIYAPGDALLPRVESVLAVPLWAEDRCIGTLELLNKQWLPTLQDGEPGEFLVRRAGFDEDDAKLVTLLGGQIEGPLATFVDRERRVKAERLETIGQLLSGVIHDFKTPMAIVSGYVQLISQQDDPQVRREYAGSILKQLDQLNQMTRELLAFARGDAKLLLRKVFVHKLADELKEQLGREMADRGIAFTIRNRYGGAARVDEVKIKRAIFNLARNAIEAMPQGGAFDVDIAREGDDVVFRLTDTGPGIPPEIRGNLFESFVTRGKVGGTGLGLAIVKKIAEDHRGAVSFETETGKGTTFLFRVPIGAEQTLVSDAPVAA
jgi:signal transduction histidine kinase